MTSSPRACANPYCRDGWVERGNNESGGVPAMPCRVCKRVAAESHTAPSDTPTMDMMRRGAAIAAQLDRRTDGGTR